MPEDSSPNVMPNYGPLTKEHLLSSGQKDWKHNIKKSIFLTPEGDRSLSEQFNTHKDVVIPGLEPDKVGRCRLTPYADLMGGSNWDFVIS